MKSSDKSREKEAKKIHSDESLRKYLKETLRLAKVRDKKKQGNKITVTDKREIKYNDDRKVDILDKYVFQSMANLIYFFEFLNRNPDLIDKFDDDIEDLLGLADFEPHNVFTRFIVALIGQFTSKEDYLDSKFEYRYRLLTLMEDAIRIKAISIYNDDEGLEYTDEQDMSVIHTDFLHVRSHILRLDKYRLRLAPAKAGTQKKTPKRIIA